MAILGILLLQLGLSAAMPANAMAATITIQSNHLDIWENKQQALFSGNVHLVREDFELFCDKLRTFYKTAKEGGGIDHALATGHVRMIQGDKQGTADSAVIDNRKQLVTLSGHAVMEQSGGRVTGETIVHNMVTKTTEVTRGENGRVKLRIDDNKMGTMSSGAAVKQKGHTP
jgi:lipopolysaccharide export system protein LptA